MPPRWTRRIVASGLPLLAVPLLSACVAARPRPVSRAPAPRPAEAEGRRTPEQVDAGLAAELGRESHLPMLTQEEAHAAMPSLFKGKEMPTLVLVGGLQPKTMEAVLATARTLRREGGLDNDLLNDVFWEVSSANDCFY